MDLHQIGNKILEKGLDKALDLLKETASDVLSPPAKELGLLLKEQITYYRNRNAIATWVKMVEYCEKHNITQKNIPLKLLVPTLEYASLEEDNFLQDKWAILLGNLIDSEQNIVSNIFPYLLSQISSDEFSYLKEIVEMHLHNIKINPDLERKTVCFDACNLREFEIANLMRLGIIREKAIQEPIYVLSNTTRIAGGNAQQRYRKVLTELGILLILACSEKSSNLLSDI